MIASLPKNEEARLNALWACRILDTPPERDYDDIASLAADTCCAPIAAVTLIDSYRQQFKSIIGIDLQEIPREYALCSHTILQNDTLVIPDLSVDPRSSDNPIVNQPNGVRFYAGAPIITSDGFALGSLCVLDFVERDITSKQRMALQTLARQVGNLIELGRRVYEQDQILAMRDEALAMARQSEARLNEAQRIAHIGSWEYDLSTKSMWRSEEQIRIMGFDPCKAAPPYEEGIKRLHPDDCAAITDAFNHVINTGEPYELDLRMIDDGGPLRWLRSVGHAVCDSNGHVARVVGTMIDITERKRAADELALQHETIRQSHHKLRLALQSGRFGTWVVDAVSGENLDISDICKAHFGFEPDAQIGGYDLHAGIHPDDRERVYDLMYQAVAAHGDFAAEYRCIWPDGSQHWIASFCSALYDASGNPEQLIGITHEITKRKLMEQEQELALILAEEHADRDTLTGLLNHRAFQKRLAEATDRASKENQQLLVVMADLDNFKIFNDVYGHVTGDRVLCMVAERLKTLCSADDIVSRFGGDEFALLLPNVGRTTVADVEAILLHGLDDMYFVPDGDEMQIPIVVSLGTATYPDQGLDPGEIIDVAEQRLQRVKSGSALGHQIDDVRIHMSKVSEGFSILDALVTSVDNKDRYTRCHSEDVMGYSLQIGRALGLHEDTLHTIAIAALLHDVGKIGVPDQILRKPGALTDIEFEAVKKHPTMGAIMVETVPGLEETLDAVRHHHERWDGLGYPAGLAGVDIPLIARIMAVADAFSAMTTNRPYRKGMEIEKAAAILKNGAGIQWDKECVDAFLRSHPTIEHNCE